VGASESEGDASLLFEEWLTGGWRCCWWCEICEIEMAGEMANAEAELIEVKVAVADAMLRD